jgi:hypothetical protein
VRFEVSSIPLIISLWKWLSYNNNQVFLSKASWGRLEIKPIVVKKQRQKHMGKRKHNRQSQTREGEGGNKKLKHKKGDKRSNKKKKLT